jgi:hypothetical protein
MGLKGGALGMVLDLAFGGDRNAVAQTVEVFRANAEKSAIRDHEIAEAALAQFAAEFAQPRQARFDRIIDGLNRVPRPAMALGALGLFVAAMVDPIWFAERMQGIALVPEPLWWLLGAVVSFYFGARHQAKSQEFQRSIAATMARSPEVQANLLALRDLGAQHSALQVASDDVVDEFESPRDGGGANAALAEWRSRDGGK